MEDWKAWITGGPRFLTESLQALLTAHQFEVLDRLPTADVDLARTAAIVVCSDDATWEQLTALGSLALGARVAVLDRYDPRRYGRAFEMGSAAVHLDAPDEAIVDVIRARMRGEILAPVGCITSFFATDRATPEFSPIERRLIAGLARGTSTKDLADEVGFSERTIRRRMHSLYFRLGVHDRDEARVVARSMTA